MRECMIHAMPLLLLVVLRTVKVWGLGVCMPLFSLRGHERGVNAIEYHPDGDRDRPYLLSGKRVPYRDTVYRTEYRRTVCRSVYRDTVSRSVYRDTVYCIPSLRHTGPYTPEPYVSTKNNREALTLNTNLS